MDILYDENMFVSVDLGFGLFCELKLTGGVGAVIGSASNELVVVGVCDSFDKVSVEHECAFEHTDHYQIEGTVLLF